MKQILIFGDSNTWGYDYDTYTAQTGVQKRFSFDERWPGLVQKQLGDDYRIIENALNSRTIAVEDPCLPHRRGITSLQEALEANAPLDLVVIQLGANEFKTMYNRPAGVIAFGLDHMVMACQRSYYGFTPPKVLIVAPAPVHPDTASMALGFNYGPEAYAKSCQVGAEYKAVAERRGCGFIDCATLDFELNTVDGVHYSRGDHQKLAAAVTAAVRDMLG